MNAFPFSNCNFANKAQGLLVIQEALIYQTGLIHQEMTSQSFPVSK